ncbi:MAG: radical SAM protein [Thermodesulfobacteriota bacterium]|nr:radical SAM protein [Thermodesulfobacteriota bacterium]
MIYNAEHAFSESMGHDNSDILSRTKGQDSFVRNALDDKHYVWLEIKQYLEEIHPDLVGVYTTTVAYPIVLKILSLAKQIIPNCVTVLGGPHVTVVPHEVMEKRDVDFILLGEAEYTLVELCNGLKEGAVDYKKIAGLGYREGEKININKSPDFIQDLKSLPIVDRDLILDIESYPNWAIGGIIMGSRGCTYNCTFCASAAIWKRRIRYRPVDDIIAEIKYLKNKYRLTEFVFMDDTFTIHRKRVREFCEKLIIENMDLEWKCSSRADFINETILDLLKNAGCSQISVGVESGSDRVLRQMKKHVTVKDTRRAAELIKKYGIGFTALFVVGMPYETADDIRQTINIIKDIEPDSVNVSTFFPYPGTEAYAEVVKHGLLPVDFDWANNLELGHHSLNNCFTPQIPPEELKNLIIEVNEIARYVNRMKIRHAVKKYWRRRKLYISHPRETFKKFISKLHDGLQNVSGRKLRS